LTGKQKIHVFVTAQTAIYHCTIASYHCTFCVSLHTILCPAVNVICQMVPQFCKVDSNKLWHDIQNEEKVIYAQFGKDLFNISKVICRKTKWPQFFGLPGTCKCV